MMSDVATNEAEKLTARQDFRYYSRKVFLAPNTRYYHEQRIDAALLLEEREPIQGALADFLYGCWYDIPYDIEHIFERVKNRLQPEVEEKFHDYINKLDYIQRSSPFATRWSVLVTPSLDEQTQRLRISIDDAKGVAKDITTELIEARDNRDWDAIEQLENEFFSHCIARKDRIAFTLVWFRLGKSDWEFSERWRTCQQRLEHKSLINAK